MPQRTVACSIILCFYLEGFVEGCLERIGEDEPEEEAHFRDLREDEGEGATLLTILEVKHEVLPGRPDSSVHEY